MKLITISAFTLYCLVLFTSCNKFLDVKPKGKMIPAEVGEFDHLLDNEQIVLQAFLDNNRGSMPGYMTDNILLSEGIGNIEYKARNHPNIERYYGYTFRAPFINPEAGDPLWNQSTYGTVKYFNNVIEGIKAIKNNDNAKEADAVMAQAYTARAWTYFHATLVYGPVYKPGGNNTVKTIPYVTTTDVGEDAQMPDLSTQEEVFARVLADLHSALPYSPEATRHPSRAGKQATLAMLAYFHLFTQHYDSVAYYANLAWMAATATGGPDKVLYNYNDLSYADPLLPPIYSGVRSPDNRINLPTSREILFFRSTDEIAGTSPYSYPSPEFIALFDQSKDLRFKYFLANDLGYQTFFNNVLYDDGEQLQYYRGLPVIGGTPKFQMTGGFSYPELLLMRAEGYARTGRLAAALDDLNLLRRYRFVTGTPDLPMPASPNELIRLVLEERRRELPLGHLKRFLDLKRFSLEPAKPWGKTSVVHQVGNDRFEGIIDSRAFIFPIVNPVLRFNKQWNIPLDTRPW